ncbi:hypothetical protein SOVF_087270 [Spinacia oleracea]|nr:hypothetical protein SOVF_087270 [Spinacia oleracea]
METLLSILPYWILLLHRIRTLTFDCACATFLWKALKCALAI